MEETNEKGLPPVDLPKATNLWVWKEVQMVQSGLTINRAIKCKIRACGPIHVGRGFNVFFAINPSGTKTFVIDNASRGILGTDLIEVANVIKSSSITVLKSEQKAAMRRYRKAREVSIEEFWNEQ